MTFQIYPEAMTAIFDLNDDDVKKASGANDDERAEAASFRGKIQN